jgi:hypothetical protein
MNIQDKPPSYAKPPRPAPDQAVAYLLGLPLNQLTLTAIIPEGGPTATATFAKSDADRMKAIKWINERQAEGKNIYFQDCSVATVNARPKKQDATLIHCAHVDLDVQGVLSPEAHATALKAIIAVLEGYKLPPTDIVCTGNGMQAFWYLDKPLPATPENIAKIENINEALRDALGGDACQDVAHLMRLPFTVNYPNAKKRGLGRVTVRSYVVRADHAEPLALHRLDQLPSKPVEAKAPAAPESIDIPDSVDLSRLPDADRQTIKKGTMATDRSAAVYAIACTMRRADYTDGEIIATIIDPDNGISAHILDQKQREPEAQAMRVIVRMNEKGVKLPDFEAFEADPPPELSADEVQEQSRLRKNMAVRKAVKQVKTKKRRDDIVRGLRIIRADQITLENLQFIWKYVLARGVHTAMAGEGGQGKSQVAYSIAASCVTGGKLPDGSKAPQGSVVFLNAEDSTGTMFAPRMRAAIMQVLGDKAKPEAIKAAMAKVIKVQSVASSEGETKFSLQDDLGKLKDLCDEIGDVVLVTIDPASSYMGGVLDGRQNTQVRAVLDPISKLAEDADIAVLSVSHFNKGTSAKAVNRVMDSVAFVTAPRAVWGVFPDPDDIEGGNDAPRLFVQLKSNMGPANFPGWSYKMKMKNVGDDPDGKAIEATCVEWTGRATMSADQIVATENEKASPRMDEAEAFLQRALANRDPPPLVEDVKQAAEDADIMPTTLMRAKRKLGVIATKPETPGGPRRWVLPRVESPTLIFDDANPDAPDKPEDFEP